ncbi:hypothetical protein ACIGNX_22310 [Actinosynnema sp. NPDC053489]|uniref:hypothetical protein n=1 Tax=Actinosynnema sp. NPDC053489 TaxID=3363916 RepID=UPI0037C72EE0
MPTASAPRRLATSLVATALAGSAVFAVTGVASAAPEYLLTLCNYSDLHLASVVRSGKAPSAAVPANRCTSVTHAGNEYVTIQLAAVPGANPAPNTLRRSYTTRYANEVFHTYRDGSVFRY